MEGSDADKSRPAIDLLAANYEHDLTTFEGGRYTFVPGQGPGYYSGANSGLFGVGMDGYSGSDTQYRRFAG